MPCIVVKTNVTLSPEDKKKLAAEAAQLAAKNTGKPIQYVMSCVQDGLAMTFAGSDENCAFVEFKSIGAINKSANKKYSAAIAAMLKNYGVDSSRVYVEFTCKSGDDWGYDGNTFA